MSRIAVFSQKGGVGKTTTALNLSAALFRHQLDPVMIDMDPQSHLTHVTQTKRFADHESLFAFYQDKTPLEKLIVPVVDNASLIPANKELIKLDSMFGKGSTILNHLRVGLDILDQARPRHIVMDCCPYLGVLSLNAIFAADLLLVPIASDYLSFQGALNVEKTLLALEKVLKRRVNRRYLLTRYDKRKGMTLEIEKKARKFFASDMCQTVISENVSIAESPQYKKSILSYEPKSSGAHDYLALYFELMSEGFIGKVL